ncbi:ABC transporter permease [Rhodococcus pyridinivorans]|uniref:ABC transporter permease n=1 Tax=Rhodococcus pyridinivorans TaxID=103816 RepID=UPI001E5A94E7|nr:ABC transporter permease [Rhodococcus pyridinivorans]MCD5419483.1 ABC transporter permease [Rhodococcus pyridinivorans]
MSVSVEPRRFGSDLAGDADTDQQPDSGATADLSPRTTRSRLAPGKPIKFGLAIGPALLLVAWIVTSATGVLDPKTLSAPWTVVTTAWELIGDGRLQSNLWTSVQRALIGGVIGVVLGLVLALAAGLSRIGEALIDGPVQIKRSIPTLALMPLAILWFGIGEEMKILLIALSVFVPVYINTYSALRGIDARYVELAETLDLSRAQFVRRIALPGALPGSFTGLRLAVTISWLALVVVEQVNASSGIGYLMYQARNYGMTEIIIVGLVVYAILGFGSDLLVRAAERKALAWRRTIGN